jgi:hypothetical protein
MEQSPLLTSILIPAARKKIAQKNPQKLPVIIPIAFNNNATPIAINKIAKNIIDIYLIIYSYYNTFDLNFNKNALS